MIARSGDFMEKVPHLEIPIWAIKIITDLLGYISLLDLKLVDPQADINHPHCHLMVDLPSNLFKIWDLILVHRTLLIFNQAMDLMKGKELGLEGRLIMKV